MKTADLHPVGKSWLGQHYKTWRESDDARNFKGNELNCYCIYNDISDETRKKLGAWERAGFP